MTKIAAPPLATPPPPARASLPRRAGQIMLGVVLGLMLVPAVLELAALAGAVSAFKYQGF